MQQAEMDKMHTGDQRVLPVKVLWAHRSGTSIAEWAVKVSGGVRKSWRLRKIELGVER
jgi:hypothetical protein